MVKVVVDANVLISAAFGGIPLEAVREAFRSGTVFLSQQITNEIDTTIENIGEKLGPSRLKELKLLWADFYALCEFGTTIIPAQLCRDPKDDAYLSLCLAVAADFLVTGDRDLLSVDLRNAPTGLRHLKIVTPRQFLAWAAGERD